MSKNKSDDHRGSSGEDPKGPLLTQGELGDKKADQELSDKGSGTQTEAGFGERHWGPGEYRGESSGVSPESDKRSDEQILGDVTEMLHHHKEIDAPKVGVTVKSGVVTLVGTVPDRRTKRLVEDVIDMVSGVVDVQNQLRLVAENDSSLAKS